MPFSQLQKVGEFFGCVVEPHGSRGLTFKFPHGGPILHAQPQAYSKVVKQLRIEWNHRYPGHRIPVIT